MTPVFPGFTAVGFLLAWIPILELLAWIPILELLAWIPILEIRVLRGVLIAVLGIGSWVVGLLVAYLLYRHYAGAGD